MKLFISYSLFLQPIPDTTYRYTSTPWMDSTTALNCLGSDATVCTNEYEVAILSRDLEKQPDAKPQSDNVVLAAAGVIGAMAVIYLLARNKKKSA